MAFIVEMWGLPHKSDDPKTWRDNRHFECGATFWDTAVSLGRENGWKPMGTIPSDADPYNPGPLAMDYEPGSYGASTMVLADDAKAWADALERAIQFEKPVNLEKKQQPILITDEMTAEEFERINKGVSPEGLKEFIAFLRRGGFGFAWDD